MTENNVMLIGYLGTDPDVGENVATMKLCTNRNFKTKNGEWDSIAEWHTLKLFGELVMKSSTFFKGDLVFAKGRIQYNKLEANNGNPARYFTDIMVNRIKLINRKEENNQAEPVAVETTKSESEDLPF